MERKPSMINRLRVEVAEVVLRAGVVLAETITSNRDSGFKVERHHDGFRVMTKRELGDQKQ